MQAVRGFNDLCRRAPLTGVAGKFLQKGCGKNLGAQRAAGKYRSPKGRGENLAAQRSVVEI